MKPRRIFALFLSLLMILSLVPGTAFAEGDTSYEDGSYTGSATVEPDEDEDFDAYDITVKVTVENGAIASVAFASEIEDEDNETYANKAMDGTKSKTGVADQIIAANGTDGVDTVSGATCTSKAIIAAVDAALKSAVIEDPGDTDTGDEDTGDEDTGDTDTGDTDTGDTDTGDTDTGDTDTGDTDTGDIDTGDEDTGDEDTGDTDTGDTDTGDGDTGDSGTESESKLTVTIPEDLQDGTYTGGATVYHDEDEAFSDYPITVAVSVSNGVVSSFSVSGASGNNAQYSTKAENGLNSQLADKTAGSYEVDAVSTATCSSKAIVEAINTALQSDPSSTSIALGSAIYDVEGTTFTVTITNPAEGVDYSDITLAYAVGKFSSDLDESAYSVALTSESENELVYTVTLVADSGTDIEDDELTHSVSYNNVGMALNVTVAGTTVGQVTIESSAVCAIENNTLTVTGGNGETLADYIDAVSELIFSYTDQETGETVTETYILQWQHDIEPEYTGSDIFNEDGSINFDYALFVYGRDGEYTLTLTATGYNEVTATVSGYTYVLMNIPYDEFYAADVNNDVAVDAVSSATKAKTQTWSLSGGSYHVSEDGSDITGVTFLVKVPVGTDLSAYTQITDDDSLEITVTNRGTTSTTTYTGYQALYQADSYSYYVLSSVPSYYKELTVNEDGSFSFSAVVGESTTITGSAELSTDTSYGDYQLDVDGITDYVTAGTDDVYGVVLHTEEGSDYGLRHLENIWRVSELAFCTGFTTSVHNCPTSSAHYEAIMGQTITSITYYTSAGIYEVALSESVYVPTKTGISVTVEDAYVLDGQTSFTMDGTLPDDFDAVYSVGIEGAVVDAENGTITFATDTDLAGYTLTISDQSGKYDDITASFSLYNYYYMNVPYSVFYDELNDDGDVDAVSSATTSKAANCKNVYLTVDEDEGTTTIYGVVIPVKISGSAYASVKDLVTDATADYYVGDALESAPTVYLELSYSSYSGYSFSAIQPTAEATTATVDATLSTASVWGDYELDLDSDYGIATTEVYGAYFTTTDGAQYAMKQSENLWTPSKYYEAAWDTIDNDYYSSMEGKTIESVTFITTSGIVEYTLSEALYVTPHMADVPVAEFTSGTTLAITGVAEDAENVTVTVKASGRNGAYLTNEAVSLVDGVATLDAAATDGTTYQVTVSSDNYASNIITAVYNVDTAALTAAIAQAQALTESDYTAESWEAMQTALADATALAAATTGKTQTEVDEIVAALTDAIDALVTADTSGSDTGSTDTDTGDDDTGSTGSDTEDGNTDASGTGSTDTDASDSDSSDSGTGSTDTDTSGDDTDASDSDSSDSDTGSTDTDTSDSDGSDASSDTDSSDDTSSTDTVKTDDESMILVYAGLLLLSGAAYVALVAARRKKD